MFDFIQRDAEYKMQLKNENFINTCQDCNAVRNYPSGMKIFKCPRCGSKRIQHQFGPRTQEERDALVIKAITGESDHD